MAPETGRLHAGFPRAFLTASLEAAILEISGLTEDQLRVALASNTTAKTDAAKTDGVDALDASTATASTVDTVEMAAAQAMRPLECFGTREHGRDVIGL